jgi:hypothetical protein
MKKFILSQQNNRLCYVSPTDNFALPANHDVELAVDYYDGTQKALAGRALVWRLVEGKATLGQQMILTDDNGRGINKIRVSPDDASTDISVRVAVWPQDEPDAVLEIDCTFGTTETASRSTLPGTIELTAPPKNELVMDTTIPITANVSNSSALTLNWTFSLVSGGDYGTVTGTSTSDIDAVGNSSTSFRVNYKLQTAEEAIVVRVDVRANSHDCKPTLPLIISFPYALEGSVLTPISPPQGEISTRQTIKLQAHLLSRSNNPLSGYEINWAKGVEQIEIISSDQRTDREGYATAIIKGKTGGTVTVPVEAPYASPSGTKYEYKLNFVQLEPSTIEVSRPDAAQMRYDTPILITAKVKDKNGDPVPDQVVDWNFAGTPAVSQDSSPSITNDAGIATRIFSYSTQHGYPESFVSTTVTATVDSHGAKVSSTPQTLNFTGPSNQNTLELLSPAAGSTHPTYEDTIITVKLKHAGTDPQYALSNYEIDWACLSSGAMITHGDSKTNSDGIASATIRGKTWGPSDFSVKAPQAGVPTLSFDLVFDDTMLLIYQPEPAHFDSYAAASAVLTGKGQPIEGAIIDWYPLDAPEIEGTPFSTTDRLGTASAKFYCSTQSGYPTAPIQATLIAKTRDGAHASNMVTLTFSGASSSNTLELVSPADNTICDIGQQITIEIKLQHVGDTTYPLEQYDIDWITPPDSVEVVTKVDKTNSDGIATATVKGKTEGTCSFTVKAPQADAPPLAFQLEFVEQNQTPSTITINRPTAGTILYDTKVPITATVKNSDGNTVAGVSVNWSFDGTPPVTNLTPSAVTNSEGIATGSFSFNTQHGYPATWVSTTVTATSGDIRSDGVPLTFTGPSNKNTQDVLSPAENSTLFIGQKAEFKIRLRHNDEYALANYPIAWMFFPVIFDVVKSDPMTNEDGIATAIVIPKLVGPVEVAIYAIEAGANTILDLVLEKQTKNIITITPPDPDSILFDTDVPISASVKNADGNPVIGELISWGFTEGGRTVDGHAPITRTNEQGVASSTFRYRTGGKGYPGVGVSWNATAHGSDNIVSEEVNLTFTGASKNNILKLDNPSDGSEWPINENIPITVTLFDDEEDWLGHYHVEWNFTGSYTTVGAPDNWTSILGAASATIQGSAAGTVDFEVSAEDAGIPPTKFSLKFTSQDAPSVIIAISLPAGDIPYDTQIPITATVTNGNGVGVPYLKLDWVFSDLKGLNYSPESTTDQNGITTGWFMYSTTDGYPEELVTATVRAKTEDDSVSSETLEIAFTGSGLHNKLSLISPNDGDSFFIDDEVPVKLKLTDWYGTKLRNYPISWDQVTDAFIKDADTSTNQNGEANATIVGTMQETVRFSAHAPKAKADCAFKLSFQKQDVHPNTITITPPSGEIRYDTVIPITATVINNDGSLAHGVKVKWIFSDIPGLHFSSDSITESDGTAKGWFIYSTTAGYPDNLVAIAVQAETKDGSVSSEELRIQFIGSSSHNKLELIELSDGDIVSTNEEIVVRLRLTNQYNQRLAYYSISWDKPNGANIEIADSSTDYNGEANATIVAKTQGTVSFKVHVPNADVDFEFSLDFEPQDKLPNTITIHRPIDANIVYDTSVEITATVIDSKGHPVRDATMHWNFTGDVEFSPTGVTNDEGEVNGWFSFSTEDGYPTSDVVTTVTLSDEFGDSAEPVKLEFKGGAPNNNLDLVVPNDASKIPINVETDVTLLLTHDHKYPLRNYPISWDRPSNEAEITPIDEKTDGNGFARAKIVGKSEGTSQFRASASEANAVSMFTLEFTQSEAQTDYIKIISPADSEMLYDSWIEVTAFYLHANDTAIPNATLVWNCTNGVDTKEKSTTTEANGSSVNYIRFETLAGYPSPMITTWVNVKDDYTKINNALELTFLHSSDQNKLTLIKPTNGSSIYVGEPTNIAIQLTNQFKDALTNYPVSWTDLVGNATFIDTAPRTNLDGVAIATIQAAKGGMISFTLSAPDAGAKSDFSFLAVSNNRPLVSDKNYAHNPPAKESITPTDASQIVTFKYTYLEDGIPQMFREIRWRAEPRGLFAQFFDGDNTLLHSDANGFYRTNTDQNGIAILKVGSKNRLLSRMHAVPTGSSISSQESVFVIATFLSDEPGYYDERIGSVTYDPVPIILPEKPSYNDKGFILTVPPEVLENSENNDIVFWVGRYASDRKPEEVIMIMTADDARNGANFPYDCLYPDAPGLENQLSYMVISRSNNTSVLPVPTKPQVEKQQS